jgi:exosortase/archaeosortase family protein
MLDRESTKGPSFVMEAQAIESEPGRPTYQLLLIAAAAIFLVLPLVTTFNEFLVRIVINLKLDALLREWVVPLEAKLIAVLVGSLGLGTITTSDTVYLLGSGRSVGVYISWNCVGWQSFILFIITLFTGLQGGYTRRSKIETITLGLLGTFLVNLLRIASVCLIAFYLGQFSAIIFHDYGGTIIILLWLFAFWYFTYNYVLESAPVEAAGEMELTHTEE